MPCMQAPSCGLWALGTDHVMLRHAHLGPLVEKPCDGLLGIELAHWERPKLLLQHETLSGI